MGGVNFSGEQVRTERTKNQTRTRPTGARACGTSGVHWLYKGTDCIYCIRRSTTRQRCMHVCASTASTSRFPSITALSALAALADPTAATATAALTAVGGCVAWLCTAHDFFLGLAELQRKASELLIHILNQKLTAFILAWTIVSLIAFRILATRRPHLSTQRALRRGYVV